MSMGLTLIWVFSTVTLLSTCSLALTEDGITLLEIKRSFNHTKGYLSDWRPTDDTPCGWKGIFCNHNDSRVSSISLPYMQLGGILSPSIGKLSSLQRLALHQNSLHGVIPSEIANCKELRSIYLRGNYLQGGIPPEFGKLAYLTILDLSSNSLKGTIPPSIGYLRQLRFLNLSTNFFSGAIPDVGVLSTFRKNSFIGNLDLCGPQINKPCPGSLGFPAVLPHGPHAESEEAPVPTKRSFRYLKGILIGAMSAVGLAIALLVVFFGVRLLSKKERAAKRYNEVKKQAAMDERTKVVTFHGDLPYSSSDIVEKLEALDVGDVLGSGGFGTVYKMVMNDRTAFAVKRIDKCLEGSDQTFERELEILASIKHVNLVNLRGYCKFPCAKLLIYDYLTLGSLDHFLHETFQGKQPLNWNTRLRIALGSARGLAYLHHDCCPRIVHRDIKSSNVLLDQNLEPHVSDFGLAQLLADEDAHVTTVVAGTFGYLAPEYLETGRATEKSDIYSFGVLLLELIAGKRPNDSAFVKRGLNIVGWMNTLVGENQLEDIVDSECTDADIDTLEAILVIAARCTDANPDDRPSMNQIFQMLEEITSPCPSEFYESHSEDSK